MRPEIELTTGDITSQDDLDAVVNAANAQLATGGGVAGAIHKAAGPELYEACKPLAPIKPGEAVITPAYKLPNKWVIHCLGPVYGEDEPSDTLLKNCYVNALRLAEENDVTSIGFPAISTGAFGYPKEDAARIAMDTIKDYAANPADKIKLIRIILWSEEDLEIYKELSV